LACKALYIAKTITKEGIVFNAEIKGALQELRAIKELLQSIDKKLNSQGVITTDNLQVIHDMLKRGEYKAPKG